MEVQERATTFRHLLAEFGLLSLTWKADMESAEKQDEVSRNKGSEFGLLDMVSASKYSSVQDVDNAGARAAKGVVNVLRAIISEPFYAVHAKAQRKVPAPESVSLTRALNAAALNQLLSTDINENVTLANISFAAPTFSSQLSNDRGGRSANSFDEEYNRYHRSGESSDIRHQDSVSYSAFAGGADKPSSSSSRHRSENDMFYLGSSKAAAQAAPSLAQILADTFDEDRKGKKSKGKKEKGRQHKADMELNASEMLPAGAISSDDEKVVKSKKSSRRQHDDDVFIFFDQYVSHSLIL